MESRNNTTEHVTAQVRESSMGEQEPTLPHDTGTLPTEATSESRTDVRDVDQYGTNPTVATGAGEE